MKFLPFTELQKTWVNSSEWFDETKTVKTFTTISKRRMKYELELVMLKHVRKRDYVVLYSVL